MLPLPLLSVQLLLLLVLLFGVNVAPLQDVLEEQAVVQSLILETGFVFIVPDPENALFSTVVKLVSFELRTLINSVYVL
jgi:hypothetical protein